MNYIQLDIFNDQPCQSCKPKKKKKIDPSEEPLEKKIERALWLLRTATADAEQPIEVSYSGGKDSDVILELARMAGIKYRAIYKNTTIDPPGTIKHCMEKGVEIVRRKSFAQVIREKGFPTFIRRFCCRELKEYKILERSVQGIRRCESTKRARRYKEPTVCRLYGKNEHVEVFLPILWWTDKDVADFIKQRGIKCHPLYYGKGGEFNPKCRLGCMGCPQKSDRGLADFKANPGLVRFWLRNGEIWWNTHELKKTKKKFKSHYEVFVRNMFFKSYEDFHDAIDGIFGKIDCKQFLEQYFNIKL
jgi:phosphoadenosine phosphosulfate reductase